MNQVDRYVDKVVEQVKPGKKVAGKTDWSTEIAAAKNEVLTHTLFIFTHTHTHTPTPTHTVYSWHSFKNCS